MTPIMIFVHGHNPYSTLVTLKLDAPPRLHLG